MMAPKSASSLAYEVSIRQDSSGIRERSSRQTVTPSPSGSRTSSTATSGRAAGTRLSASAAVEASPTTSRSGSAPSRSATPRRTTSWSSRRKTRIVPPDSGTLVDLLHGAGQRTGRERTGGDSCHQVRRGDQADQSSGRGHYGNRVGPVVDHQAGDGAGR